MRQMNPGDIVMMNFDPTRGHEQAGYRPAVIVSNQDYGRLMQLAIVCPITNTHNNFPVHIPLDERTKTTGCVLCEHVRTVDLTKRETKFVEKIPEDIFDEIKEIVISFFE
ncbi:type II toxin-antitoxin system PemK/MazF family toxin [Dielma fastidiosa]|uniref:mRNA interferase MazF n=1 Tax=Dielma fastidiosa TaxID=1034346 RepID=A0A318L417_9FIRM|nr:type II toxin-antitoxin system PemK/MazF family toxin [Dielma fastidiosa]PXX75946.1 mRNA interferase MazF [Dielma fastidiosa]